ncbi:MAG: trypsin-like peptidase domain-containing protein [Bacteroidales bacterium]|nr:trypsin-like peptidase domain-containing protein [Bacteroidales bacterium]
MKTLLEFFVCIFLLSNCTNSNNNAADSLREEELHNQELKIKEQEIALQKHQIDILKEQQNNNTNNIMDLPNLYKKVKPSVYLIYTLRSQEVSQGSAFVISSDGIAISNYHVFESASDAIAINENGDKFQISEILDYDREIDYIIFRLNTMRPLFAVEISDLNPQVGEDCFAVGNPEGLTQTLSKGIVSSFRENERYIQTTTEITHGSSGGPLFNQFGKVIGITSSGKSEANLNFAVNIHNVPYSRYLNIGRKENTQPDFDIIQAKNLIKQYYSIVERGSFEDINSIFDSRMSRFFSYFDIDVSQVIELSKGYNNKFGIIKSHSKVRWESFRMNKLENGNYSVDYILDYNLTRINKSKPSTFVLHIIAELTHDYHVKGIYEDIIDKY